VQATWQSATRVHRQAFAGEAAGRLYEAVPLYAKALEEFSSVLTGSGFNSILRNRACLIVGEQDVGVLVEDYLGALPRWLLDVHYKRAVHAVRAGDMIAAQAHWMILTGAGNLAMLVQDDFMDTYRESLALTFLGGGDSEYKNLLQESEARG